MKSVISEMIVFLDGQNFIVEVLTRSGISREIYCDHLRLQDVECSPMDMGFEVYPKYNKKELIFISNDGDAEVRPYP